MSSGPIGKRYARALLSLSEEAKLTDRIARELTDVVASYETSRELREIFENPAIGAQTRGAVIDALARRMGLAPLLRNTLMLLSDRRRMRYLPQLAEAFQDLSEERTGRIRAEVTTAGAMPEAYFAELQRALEEVTGKKIVLQKKQDPALIGGVVTKVGDKVFDGSIQNRLRGLEEELLSR
ncbi:MAG: ATP synthase F1 subunit delta [Myxococcales bacterium]|nr:ATP synthase F1 subunit delta [Myxococcales bacterium]